MYKKIRWTSEDINDFLPSWQFDPPLRLPLVFRVVVETQPGDHCEALGTAPGLYTTGPRSLEAAYNNTPHLSLEIPSAYRHIEDWEVL